jgi:hypothetical protein
MLKNISLKGNSRDLSQELLALLIIRESQDLRIFGKPKLFERFISRYNRETIILGI